MTTKTWVITPKMRGSANLSSTNAFVAVFTERMVLCWWSSATAIAVEIAVQKKGFVIPASAQAVNAISLRRSNAAVKTNGIVGVCALGVDTACAARSAFPTVDAFILRALYLFAFGDGGRGRWILLAIYYALKILVFVFRPGGIRCERPHEKKRHSCHRQCR